MKIMSETVQVIDNDSGRVHIETDIGKFFVDFTFDPIEETVEFEYADSFDKVLDAETFADEYAELDKRSYELLVTRNPVFIRTCKQAQEENRYFRVACGCNEYAYYGVSISDF